MRFVPFCASLLLLAGSAFAADQGPAPPDPALCSGDAADPAVVAFYPPDGRAGLLDGNVVVRCFLGRRGGLHGCQTVAEHPAGFGFGEAALAMLATSVDNPRVDYGGYRLEQPVTFRVRFKADPPSISPNLVGKAHLVEPPRLVHTPDENQLSLAYPVRAEANGVTGLVMLGCSVRLDGHLDDCSIAARGPETSDDLANRSLGLARDFKATPLKCDGRAVDGARIIVPINYKWWQPGLPK